MAQNLVFALFYFETARSIFWWAVFSKLWAKL